MSKQMILNLINKRIKEMNENIEKLKLNNSENIIDKIEKLNSKIYTLLTMKNMFESSEVQ